MMQRLVNLGGKYLSRICGHFINLIDGFATTSPLQYRASPNVIFNQYLPMTNNLNIRKADSSDASNIAALAMHVWLHTYAKEGIRQEISDFVFSHFSPDTIGKLILDPAKQMLVAYDDMNLLGYAVLHYRSECPANTPLQTELATLYVQPHFAGKGIGSALLKACLEATFAASADTSLWLTTWHRNDNAIKFYLKQGFKMIGSTYFELGEEKHENFIFAR